VIPAFPDITSLTADPLQGKCLAASSKSARNRINAEIVLTPEHLAVVRRAPKHVAGKDMNNATNETAFGLLLTKFGQIVAAQTFKNFGVLSRVQYSGVGGNQHEKWAPGCFKVLLATTDVQWDAEVILVAHFGFAEEGNVQKVFTCMWGWQPNGGAAWYKTAVFSHAHGGLDFSARISEA
jgi:hypothetical protein